MEVGEGHSGIVTVLLQGEANVDIQDNVILYPDYITEGPNGGQNTLSLYQYIVSQVKVLR